MKEKILMYGSMFGIYFSGVIMGCVISYQPKYPISPQENQEFNI